MKILLIIAWRNLWRQSRRTLLTSTTLAFGLALLLISLGIADGSHNQMIESAVRMGSGHVVIQREGFQRFGGIERVFDPVEIKAIERWLRTARKDYPIIHVTKRVIASGLVTSTDGAARVEIFGVQPSLEKNASLFSKRLDVGEFLDDGDKNQILLGRGVARKLDVKPGDKVVLKAQGFNSAEIQEQLARVKGLLDTGQEEIDQVLVLAPLNYCQEFLNLGTRVHQVAVLLEDHRLSQDLARQGEGVVAKSEVLSWDESLPELRDFIRIDNGSNYVFHAFLFLLIAFMVLNTLLMSVLERDREFSLLDALGLTAKKRFFLVLLEAFFIAALSCAAGFILGYAGHLYLEAKGLPLDIFYHGKISAAGVALDPVLRSALSLNRIVQAIATIFAMTMLLALLPAKRAAIGGNVQMLGS